MEEILKTTQPATDFLQRPNCGQSTADFTEPCWSSKRARPSHSLIPHPKYMCTPSFARALHKQEQDLKIYLGLNSDDGVLCRSLPCNPPMLSWLRCGFDPSMWLSDFGNPQTPKILFCRVFCLFPCPRLLGGTSSSELCGDYHQEDEDDEDVVQSVRERRQPLNVGDDEHDFPD